MFSTEKILQVWEKGTIVERYAPSKWRKFFVGVYKALSEAIISLYSDNHRLEVMKKRAFDYSERGVMGCISQYLI